MVSLLINAGLMGQMQSGPCASLNAFAAFAGCLPLRRLFDVFFARFLL